ncbi:MAG: hypothetical protein GY754_32065 [bacterium]|nr:hypothetical protein [bacterium]
MTFNDYISLKQLVEISDFIIIVEKADPYTVRKKISILPEGSIYKNKNIPPYYEPPYHGASGKPETDKNYPPYIESTYHFKVVEILYETKKKFIPNEKISVLEAHRDARLDLHKMYYLEGRRKSPIYKSYKSSLSYDNYVKRKKIIIFIKNNCIFPVNYSYESLDKKDTILNLIQRLKAKKRTRRMR